MTAQTGTVTQLPATTASHSSFTKALADTYALSAAGIRTDGNSGTNEMTFGPTHSSSGWVQSRGTDRQSSTGERG